MFAKLRALTRACESRPVFDNEVLEESLEKGKVQDETLGCTSYVEGGRVELGGKLKYKDRVELGIKEVATKLSLKVGFTRFFNRF